MTRHVWRIEIGRVAVSGVDARRIDRTELRSLIEHALARDVANGPLPGGRTVRTVVRVDAPRFAGDGHALAAAVSTALARAIGRGR